MAIDKSNTSPLMKGLIIFLAVTFVLGIGFSSFVGSCSPATPTTSGSNSSSTGATQTVESVNLQFTPVIKAVEASITADPKNYDLLVSQADNYYQWGAKVREVVQSSGATSTEDTPIWKAAVTYYARALAVKSGDTTVMGDYAVALFYSGDSAAAIAEGEKVRTIDPKFAPNLFNLGIFYHSTGDKVKAKAAYEAYLAAAPTGDMAQAAKDNIAALAQP